MSHEDAGIAAYCEFDAFSIVAIDDAARALPIDHFFDGSSVVRVVMILLSLLLLWWFFSRS
jgi:hypothetical protein